jgi:hypothetical protein
MRIRRQVKGYSDRAMRLFALGIRYRRIDGRFAGYVHELGLKYERAARDPWLSVEPDPPMPTWVARQGAKKEPRTRCI